jgi:hypothetical protein
MKELKSISNKKLRKPYKAKFSFFFQRDFFNPKSIDDFTYSSSYGLFLFEWYRPVI